MHNNNYRGQGKGNYSIMTICHIYKDLLQDDRCMAGAAGGLWEARPVPGKIGLSRKPRLALVTSAGIWVQRSNLISCSSWRLWPSRGETPSRSVTGCRAQWSPGSSCSWYLVLRCPVLVCIGPHSRLGTTSGGNITVHVTQRRRLHSPKSLLLLRCMTICSLIFFLC